MSERYFITLSTNGQSKVWDMATNAPAKPPGTRTDPPKPKPCGCATCSPRPEPDPTPAPFDREAAVQHARQLDERAQNATTDTERRTWEERALLVWDLIETEDRKAAREAAIMTEVRMGREIRPIIGAAWEDSVLND